MACSARAATACTAHGGPQDAGLRVARTKYPSGGLRADPGGGADAVPRVPQPGGHLLLERSAAVPVPPAWPGWERTSIV